MDAVIAFDNEHEGKGRATATFALGCFWGPDARFGVIPGVVRTRVGYAGGDMDNPTYHNLDGHTETLQLDYNPDTVSYKELLHVFWKRHNPHRQPLRRQYKHILFTHNAEQEKQAEQTRQQIETEKGKPVKTAIQQLDTFHAAEAYHQKYHLRQHTTVLDAFTERYTDKELRDSTAAARINGYLAGYGTETAVDDTLAQLDFAAEAEEQVRESYRRATRSIRDRVKHAAANLFSAD